MHIHWAQHVVVYRRIDVSSAVPVASKRDVRVHHQRGMELRRWQAAHDAR